MSHGSARLTVHGRLLIVQRHQAGWRQAHIAAAMGVSRKCVKTWIDRYAAEGEPGLRDRSSVPGATRLTGTDQNDVPPSNLPVSASTIATGVTLSVVAEDDPPAKGPGP